MRTYDDTFSGQRIYPGKVGFSEFPFRWAYEVEEAALIGEGKGISDGRLLDELGRLLDGTESPLEGKERKIG